MDNQADRQRGWQAFRRGNSQVLKGFCDVFLYQTDTQSDMARHLVHSLYQPNRKPWFFK